MSRQGKAPRFKSSRCTPAPKSYAKSTTRRKNAGFGLSELFVSFLEQRKWFFSHLVFRLVERWVHGWESKCQPLRSVWVPLTSEPFDKLCFSFLFMLMGVEVNEFALHWNLWCNNDIARSKMCVSHVMGSSLNISSMDLWSTNPTSNLLRSCFHQHAIT